MSVWCRVHGIRLRRTASMPQWVLPQGTLCVWPVPLWPLFWWCWLLSTSCVSRSVQPAGCVLEGQARAHSAIWLLGLCPHCKHVVLSHLIHRIVPGVCVNRGSRDRTAAKSCFAARPTARDMAFVVLANATAFQVHRISWSHSSLAGILIFVVVPGFEGEICQTQIVCQNNCSNHGSLHVTTRSAFRISKHIYS